MFCPFCKADYRTGIHRCSDCGFALVEVVPKDASDLNFMVLLWNGESLGFLETVCAELDRAQIAVAAPGVEVFLRDPADRYHLKGLKTFPYVLGVFKRDFDTARRILESVAAKSSPLITLPPRGAYPEPFDEPPALLRPARHKGSLEATIPVHSSDDLRAVEFLEASLSGLDIPFRRVRLENGVYETQVRPADENAARRVVQEISGGISSQAAAAKKEDSLLHDEPPTNYFLAWFCPLAFWFFFFMLALFGRGTNPAAAAAYAVLLGAMEALSVIGSFWMVYQALRYEVKPARYCLMALVPLTCIWYYVERYMGRKGPERLPVASRIRTQLPPSS